MALVALVLCAACSSGGAGLSEKKYPEGYSLKQPAGWQAQVVDKAYILVSSPEIAKEPAFLFVYPFFLKAAIPTGDWFEQTLPKLSKFFVRPAIEKRQRLRARPDEWAVKVRFEKNGAAYSGLALCSIFERSGVLYVAASKADSFEKNRSMLLAMLQSFRFGEPTAGKGPAVPKVQYVNFSDPVEQAFSLDVPQGWQTQGGTSRRASVDLVHALQTVLRTARSKFNSTTRTSRPAFSPARCWLFPVFRKAPGILPATASGTWSKDTCRARSS